MKTADQVKAEFVKKGITFTSWAQANGYRSQYVSQVVNGFMKGHRGKAHEIMVKLGMKN